MTLKIQITKRSDGGGVLRCTRADGSVTWQKQTDRHAAFFALHDLTHFAVESLLGFRRGFYGLMAEGWEIEDTTGKHSPRPFTDEDLARVRKLRSELFTKWFAVEPGRSLAA